MTIQEEADQAVANQPNSLEKLTQIVNLINQNRAAWESNPAILEAKALEEREVQEAKAHVATIEKELNVIGYEFSAAKTARDVVAIQTCQTRKALANIALLKARADVLRAELKAQEAIDAFVQELGLIGQFEEVRRLALAARREAEDLFEQFKRTSAFFELHGENARTTAHVKKEAIAKLQAQWTDLDKAIKL